MSPFKAILAIIICITVFTACSSKANDSTTSTVEQLQKQVAALQTENEDLKKQLEASKTTEPAANDADTSEPGTETETAADKNSSNVVELNQPWTIKDYAELKLKGVAFTSKVTPPKPDGMYSYYEVKDPNNIYMDIVLNIKSLLTSGQSADEFVKATVKYDSKYQYDSFSTIEDKGGTDFTYTNIVNIEPLKSGNLHYIAELPKEASKDTKPIDIIIACNGQEFTYKWR